MIKARQNILARTLYRIYAKRLLKSNFKKFIILNSIPGIDNTKGVIVTPNHFSWWDGFFIDFTMKSFTKRDGYIMMLEEQLKKYWFFRHVGAFSIRNSSAGTINRSISYARRIADSSDKFLIFYPQGKIQFYEKEYVMLKKGIGLVCNDLQADVLIVSFKIVYTNEKKPTVFCRFGENISARDVADNFLLYEKSFIKNLELLDNEIVNNISEAGKDLFNQ